MVSWEEMIFFEIKTPDCKRNVLVCEFMIVSYRYN